MKISELIRSLRLKKNLTMEQLGQLVGVDKSQVSNWESGKRNPGITNLHKLTEVLGHDFVNLANTVQENENNAQAVGKGEAIFITHHNVMWVPLVTQYAYAGYLSSYQNHTYMEELEKIPFFTDHLGKGNYLAFEVRGDSMDDGSRDSIVSGDRLLCREVNSDYWRSKLHLNKWTFVIVHKTEGIIIKKITDHDIENGVITIHSLNSEYPDQQIELNDVKQLFNVIKFDRKL